MFPLVWAWPMSKQMPRDVPSRSERSSFGSVQVVMGMRGMFSSATTTPFSAPARSSATIDLLVSFMTEPRSSWPSGEMKPGCTVIRSMSMRRQQPMASRTSFNDASLRAGLSEPMLMSLSGACTEYSRSYEPDISLNRFSMSGSRCLPSATISQVLKSLATVSIASSRGIRENAGEETDIMGPRPRPPCGGRPRRSAVRCPPPR